jgi:hypothetical protein
MIEEDDVPSLHSPTCVVHKLYDISTLPPKPSEEWTRFVCVSDTHSREFPVPAGDVLLHGGDLTNLGKLSDFRTTVEWLRGLPHPTKMYVLISPEHNGGAYS